MGEAALRKRGRTSRRRGSCRGRQRAARGVQRFDRRAFQGRKAGRAAQLHGGAWSASKNDVAKQGVAADTRGRSRRWKHQALKQQNGAFIILVLGFNYGFLSI